MSEYNEYDLTDLINAMTNRDDIHGRTARTCTQPDWAKLRAIIVNVVDNPQAMGVGAASSYWRTLAHPLRSPVVLSMLSLLVSEIADATAVRALPLLERLYKSYDLA